MLQKIVLFFLYFSAFTDCFSQTKIKITFLDAHDASPLQSVVLLNSSGKVLFISTQPAFEEISIDTLENNLDSMILIVREGYENTQLKLRNLIDLDTILLNKQSRLLDEVVIRQQNPGDIFTELSKKFTQQFAQHYSFHAQVSDYHISKLDKFVGLFNCEIELNSKKNKFDKFQIKKLKSISTNPELLNIRMGFYKLSINILFFHEYGLFRILQNNTLSWDWSPRKSLEGQDEIFSVIETPDATDTIFIAFDITKNELVAVSRVYGKRDSNYSSTTKIKFFNKKLPLFLTNYSKGLYGNNFICDTSYILLSKPNQQNTYNQVFDIENRGKFILKYQKKLQDSILNNLLDTLLKTNQSKENGIITLKINYHHKLTNKNKIHRARVVFNKIETIDFGSMYRIKYDDRDYETIYNGSQVCILRNQVLKVYDYEKYGLSLRYRDLFEPVTRTQHFFYTYRSVYDSVYSIKDTVVEGRTVKALFFQCNGLYRDFNTYVTIYFDSVDYTILGLKERQDLENGNYWESFIWVLEYQYNNPSFVKLFHTQSIAKGLKVKFKKPSFKDRKRYKYMKILEKKILNNPNKKSKNGLFGSLIEYFKLDTFSLNQFLNNTEYIGKQPVVGEHKLNAYFFWFNSCFYCKKLYPLLLSIQKDFGNRILLHGINTVDKIEELVEEGWKPLIPFSGTYYGADELDNLLGVEAYPTIIIAEPNGNIIYRGVGYDEIDKELYKVLQKYFKQNE